MFQVDYCLFKRKKKNQGKMTEINHSTMFHLMNKQYNDSIKECLESYLKNKSPDCIFYSEDGAEFKTHKELLSQTKFMRELVKNSSCCSTLEIICPCSKEELRQLTDFLNDGNISCVNETEFSKILENLKKILGFPADLDCADNFSFTNQTDTLADENSFPNNSDNENESVEIISDDTIFIVPTTDIKKETADVEFQAGLDVLDEMDESISHGVK